MRFERMHHVAIIVSDYRRAKEFYVEKLGLPVLRENFRPDRGEVTGAGEDPAAVLLVEDLMVAVTPGPLGDGRCQLLLPADYSAIPVRREEKCLLYPRG